ncbi:MAG: hypothetical protein H6740_25280 [Alphaproteobacteria bacterium]|nr:hypothetical protein [Alphaproteobacteria bacterium]
MDIDPRFFDVRVVEKNIARGRITREQHEAFLESLPDDSKLSSKSAASMAEVYNARISRQSDGD